MSQSPVKVWRKQKHDRNILEKKGRIISWTEINIAPPRYASKVPYTVVLVELEDKKMIYGQLVDFENNDRKIGKKVRSVLRRNGDVQDEEVIEYAIKFIPIV